MIEIKNAITYYKNTPIEYNFYWQGEFSVQYCGDDILFNSIEDAEKFIDDIID